MSFAEAAPGREQGEETKVVRGVLPPGSPDYVYLPVEVPHGVRELHVSYTYERTPVPAGTRGNALDIGVFDERGTALGGEGFRGWSGGARTEFFVRADAATPGYVAGPVRAGAWHIVLGPYTVAPAGLPYEVTVTLRYGEAGRTPRAVHPPERARGRGRAWYRGDCHLHSWFSDGRRTPGEIAAAARAAGLDFIHTSEHNTHAGHGHWAEHAGDDLLILTGEEVTTRNGHVLALGTDPGTFIDWRYRARDNRFPRFAREIRRAGGLVVPAHPHASCFACNWKFGFAEADVIEVWNGPFTPDDEVSLQQWDSSLARGRFIPAMGNSDAHTPQDPVGSPQTVVLADDLSRGSILRGLREGRSYVAESSGVSVSFAASASASAEGGGGGGGRGPRAGIGERLKVDDDTPVTIRLEVSGLPGCTMRLITDQGVLHTTPALPSDGPGAGAGVLEWGTTPRYAGYVRAEVRHPAGAGGGLGRVGALTNPVFLGGGG